MIVSKFIHLYPPTRSTVTVDKEDGRLWIYVTVTKHGDSDNNRTSYKIRIMKTGKIVTRTARYIRKA